MYDEKKYIIFLIPDQNVFKELNFIETSKARVLSCCAVNTSKANLSKKNMQTSEMIFSSSIAISMVKLIDIYSLISNSGLWQFRTLIADSAF